MKRLNGIQFRGAVTAAVHKIAASLNVKVSLNWTGDISTAAINECGDIYLANVADDAVVTEALVWKYAGFVLHELLHRLYSNFNARSDKKYIAALHNAIEDAWIEHNAIKAKMTGNCEELLTRLVTGMVDESMTTVADWSDPAQYPFALAVYCRDHAPNVPLADGLEPIFAEAKVRTKSCTSSADTLVVAQWVYSQLRGLKKDQDKSKDKSQDKGQGKGQGKDQGKGQDKGQGKGQDKGQGKGSQTDSKGPNSNDQGQGKGKGKAQAKAPAGEDAPAAEVEPTIKGTGGNGGSYNERRHVAQAEEHRGYYQWDTDFNANARLRYEVRRLFENSANDEWQINRRAGSLNVRALPKVSTSDRLFKRRLETDGVDSAVVILLDVSGSMFPDRIGFAVKTAASMMDTLQRAGVKVAIHTFGSRVAVLKPFDMPMQRGLERLRSVGEGGATNDYQALRFTHQALYNRAEQRKAVFVITDGEGSPKATRDQAAAGESLGITTVGIGIQHGVSHVYPKSIRIQSMEDLSNASFKQIKLAA